MIKISPQRMVSANIKRFMQIAGVNQKDLAQMIGICPSALSHKMNGKNSREFNPNDLATIARALSRKCGFKITAKDLMEGVE